MDSRAIARVAAYAGPGLALAAAGLFHPHSLNPSSAPTWFWLHVAGLAVFPLVGVALAMLVRGRTDPLAWVVRLGAYVYATFYTALDVISGIAAGYVTNELGAGVPRPDEVRLLFRIGTPLGEVGSWALLLVAVVLLVDAVRRHGGPGALALLLLPGAWLVHVDHIFSPGGAAGMALIGLGTAAIARLEQPGTQQREHRHVAG
ncbi:hypothetical protein KUV85_14330 [Nocardioides panacisoli]|uniref:hypothetical protein n=1 Tax=Nocardioides panacisoli TaxID=627624 RepID=UPI001C62F38F|nr:hypothetical protein [Nocardioides panacisoli]QYJ03495.1 hypothetical protein KUV85_14330 [Nocardioides panacisoli]